MKTMFLTKYVLSGGGIQAVEGRPSESGQYLWMPGMGNFKVGRDVFHSREDALANAEARRAAKIISLERQIAKLRKMTFALDSLER